MAKLDPLQQVYQGQAGTGAAGIFPQRDTTPVDLLGKRVEPPKPDTKAFGKTLGKLTSKTPWAKDKQFFGKQYDGLVRTLTDMQLKGQNIDTSPEAQQMMYDYMVGVTDSLNQEKMYYDAIDAIQSPGMVDRIDATAYMQDLETWANTPYGQRGSAPVPSEYLLEQPEEPIDIGKWFNTNFQGTKFMREDVRYDEDTGQKIATTTIDQNKIDDRIEQIMQLPVAQKLADDNTGGDLEQLEGLLERMIIDRIKIENSRLPYDNSGSKGAKHNLYMNRYDDIQHILNRFNFADQSKVDLSNKIAQRMLGGYAPNNERITDVEFVMGYRPEGSSVARDAAVLTTSKDKVPIYLDDPASMETINRALTTSRVGENITYEELGEWINETDLPKKFVENPRDRSKDISPSTLYDASVSILETLGESDAPQSFAAAFEPLREEIIGLAYSDGSKTGKVQDVKFSSTFGGWRKITITLDTGETVTVKPNQPNEIRTILNNLTDPQTGQKWIPQTPVDLQLVEGGATVTVPQPNAPAQNQQTNTGSQQDNMTFTIEDVREILKSSSGYTENELIEYYESQGYKFQR